MHWRVTVLCCSATFIYLFISLHQGHFKYLLFSNDLLVYKYFTESSFFFSPAFLLYTSLILKCFYNARIMFSELALDLGHIPKVRKCTELSLSVLSEGPMDSL